MTALAKLTLPLLFLAVALSACSDPPKEDPPAGCTAGDEGCECNADMTCSGDLVCFNAICVPEDQVPDPNPGPNPDPNPGPNPDPNPGPNPDPNPEVDPPVEGVGIEIGNEDARACEVVLIDSANKIAEVSFSDATKGRFMRRGERVAIAAHAMEDNTINTADIGFVFAEGIDDIDGISVAVGRCFNLQGQAIDGIEVKIVDER